MTRRIFIHKHIDDAYHTRNAARMFGVIVFCALGITAIATPVASFASDATVTNSISVTQNGEGTSHTSVKTVINGKTVQDENITKTGSFEFDSRIHVDDATVTVNANTAPNTSDETDIRALMRKLINLMQYYVQLLNTIP